MIYDYTTKNKSFLQMSVILKNKGIKNNKFFLALYDHKLQGVDPYDPDLSIEMKARVQREVKINMWYFMREVVRIPESGGHTHFKLHLANLAQLYCMLCYLKIIEVLPRQFGKTIGAVCYYVWQYHFASKNSSSIFCNKDLDGSKENLKRFKLITEALPDYLKSHLDPKTDTDNLVKVHCEMNNNSIRVLSSPNNVQSAEKMGRGLTVAIIWFILSPLY